MIPIMTMVLTQIFIVDLLRSEQNVIHHIIHHHVLSFHCPMTISALLKTLDVELKVRQVHV